MSARFKNKYRIETSRLKNWDYGSNAKYFVTICTKNREHFFGDCENGRMILNDIGTMVESEWLKTFEIRPDMNLFMGEYVVMPNHFHGIVGIGLNEYNSKPNPKGDLEHDCSRNAMHCVSTTTKTTPPAETPKSQNRFGPQSKNLGSIIRGFKSAVTVRARSINPDFAWQPLFHDHIIRNEKSFHQISQYIIDNPVNWNKDAFY